jgi:hypothetical protein
LKNQVISADGLPNFKGVLRLRFNTHIVHEGQFIVSDSIISGVNPLGYQIDFLFNLLELARQVLLALVFSIPKMANSCLFIMRHILIDRLSVGLAGLGLEVLDGWPLRWAGI